jgi:DNA invertase Pin-like site-specific DNA recombinase
VVGVDRHRPSNLERRQSHLASVVAARPGWHLVPGYADVGSGRLDRPGLGRLLADAAAGRFEIVVVDDHDRLCRNPRQRAWIEKRLATAGLRVLPLAASLRRRDAAVLSCLVISDCLNS